MLNVRIFSGRREVIFPEVTSTHEGMYYCFGRRGLIGSTFLSQGKLQVYSKFKQRFTNGIVMTIVGSS